MYIKEIMKAMEFEETKPQINADERRLVALNLSILIGVSTNSNAIHDPFNFYSWLTEIDQKA